MKKAATTAAFLFQRRGQTIYSSAFAKWLPRRLKRAFCSFESEP